MGTPGLTYCCHLHGWKSGTIKGVNAPTLWPPNSSRICFYKYTESNLCKLIYVWLSTIALFVTPKDGKPKRPPRESWFCKWQYICSWSTTQLFKSGRFPADNGRSPVVCLFVFKQIQKCSFLKKGKNIYTSVSAHMAPAAHVEKDQVTRREGKSETCTLGLYLSFKFCVTWIFIP